MLKAVIDVGTNSVKYLLADICFGGKTTIIKDMVKITRLGEGMQNTGRISTEALFRTIRSVEVFAEDAKNSGAEKIRIVGTMALRSAANAADFSAGVKKFTGVDAEVLSERDEAALSFKGAVSDFDLSTVGRYCTIDTGGGSTEIVFAEGGEIVSSVSLKTGALLLTESYFSKNVLSTEDLMLAETELKMLFEKIKPPFKTELAVGIGGNATAMASVFKGSKRHDPTKIHGTVLTIAEIDRQVTEYMSKNREERRKIKGLDPERADIIPAGACIIRYFMRFCGSGEIVVSCRGLRHGILFSL